MKATCKKLKKVGEPFRDGKKLIQCLRLKKYRCDGCYYEKDKYTCNKGSYCEPGSFYVAIKQTQEDMEEKKLNLKPFDLQKAKAGKPVCTRDGRKARIICFDRQHESNIVALIPEENEEYVCTYNSDGSFRKGTTHENDLMMLPEKKEGWVNVYKMADGQIIIGQYPYESEDYCRNIGRTEDGYINTIKIEWNE